MTSPSICIRREIEVRHQLLVLLVPIVRTLMTINTYLGLGCFWPYKQENVVKRQYGWICSKGFLVSLI